VPFVGGKMDRERVDMNRPNVSWGLYGYGCSTYVGCIVLTHAGIQ